MGRLLLGGAVNACLGKLLTPWLGQWEVQSCFALPAARICVSAALKAGRERVELMSVLQRGSRPTMLPLRGRARGRGICKGLCPCLVKEYLPRLFCSAGLTLQSVDPYSLCQLPLQWGCAKEVLVNVFQWVAPVPACCAGYSSTVALETLRRFLGTWFLPCPPRAPVLGVVVGPCCTNPGQQLSRHSPVSWKALLMLCQAPSAFCFVLLECKAKKVE